MKKTQFGRPVLCDSAISINSIVPPPTPISAKSWICHCVGPLFLGYRSDLKHVKSNYRHTLFSKHYFTLNTPVLSLLKALYYIVAKSENGSVTKDYILICVFRFITNVFVLVLDLVYLYLYLYLINTNSLYLYLYL